MKTEPKFPANEEDKYKKKHAREAAEQEEDTQFLNEEGLEDDLIDAKFDEEDGKDIISPEHPENQEWKVREKQNRH